MSKLLEKTHILDVICNRFDSVEVQEDVLRSWSLYFGTLQYFSTGPIHRK